MVLKNKISMMRLRGLTPSISNYTHFGVKVVKFSFRFIRLIIAWISDSSMLMHSSIYTSINGQTKIQKRTAEIK